MPLQLLRIKCELENINKLYFSENTLWKFDIQSNDGEERKGITVSSSDDLEISGSKGKNIYNCNFLLEF